MKQNKSKQVVLLAGPGISTDIVFNALQKRFDVPIAIIEHKENTSVFLKRRVRKLGYITVAGQILFQLIVVPALRFFSAAKLRLILDSDEFSQDEIPTDKKREVLSINDQAVVELLSEINPGVVVVNGTRMISKKILTKIECPIINMHAGITPMYRGVHGGYWSMVKNERNNCGVTVHLVDAGVDTGSVIDQAYIETDKSDNFVTYPLKQLKAGIPLLIQAVEDALQNKLTTKPTFGSSNQWFHPTLWQYCYYRIFKGIK